MTSQGGTEGGGDIDEDSEGMEFMKEQMYAHAEEIVREAERKLQAKIHLEFERVMSIHNTFSN
jgi:hypothetical protein